jgi:hypothetical protein
MNLKPKSLQNTRSRMCFLEWIGLNKTPGVSYVPMLF